MIRLLRRRRARAPRCACTGPDGQRPTHRNGDILPCKHGRQWMFHADGWGSSWWQRMAR